MREETGVELGPVPRLIGVDHRVDVLGTGPVLDRFFYGGTLPDGAHTTVRLSAEHDRHGWFAPVDPHGTPLAAGARTLTALHEAALSASVVCLREGSPSVTPGPPTPPPARTSGPP
ncbi:hypothetical protein [Streptomyces sp. NPDC001292]|uniref:hypothetical protein n=1 Tax=Streptomyces sp. NPDC001292 TaxID=3364558 RepID=UPI0036935360